MMTRTASAPTQPTPDQTTLRRALTEIQAGNYEPVLAVLTPYAKLDDPQIQTLLGLCHAGLYQYDQAAKLLCAVATKSPTAQHPLQDLSDIMVPQDRRADILAVCRAALKLTPQDARVHDAMGGILGQLGQFDEAIEILRQSVSLRPNSTLSANLLAMVLAEKGNMDEALDVLNATLAAHPDHAGTLSNIGCVLSGMGRLEEALDLYRKAIAYRPSNAQIRLNHSITLLKAGCYAQGWAEHEWRFQLPGHSNLPSKLLMPSLGPDTDIRGKRVLITQEEGLGDTLMYLRYIEPLARRGAIPHLWVPDSLGDLCRRVTGAAVVQVGGETPEFDWHCPFISLPRVFAATEDAMGAPVPYLKADARKVKEFASLVPQNGKLNVGLVWGGSPRPNLVGPHMVDRRRSMNLQTLAPLAHVPGINLISLQKGPYADQMLDPPEDMILYDPTDDLQSMDDTAALIMSLDVVVSVDTSCVHLAGGLGKPVLLMDRYDNCWRWLHGQSNSPWYPTLRILRQTTPRKWDEVVHKVALGLTDMAKHKQKTKR
ncbi:tetratricopeptide repeat protein [Acetobacter indonesiensis]|uniref:tetratricopeptide repeat protein n=1 Tax=Acetobacter indonesiensis TaxID=104101 RepID=UPI0038D12691